MSIVTKTGDGGATALMYNRRVSKCDPRMEACGSLDELNAALGVARAQAQHDFIRERLRQIQPQLFVVMGELATALEDLPRYLKDGFTPVSEAMVAQLDEVVREVEADRITFEGWAVPGDHPSSAALDMARTICRRAERRVCALSDAGQLPNGQILVYLNRLSDVLWLLARWVDARMTKVKT